MLSAGEWVTQAGRTAAGYGYTYWHATMRRDPLMQLFTGSGRRSRYALFERLQAQGPIQPSTTGFLSVTGHAVADALLRSRHTSVHTPGESRASQLELSLLELDPPDHTRLRALVAPAFTARRMREQEARIAAAIEALADRLERSLADGPVDLMAAYAKPLPVVMICALLGIPDADASGGGNDQVAALTRYGDAIGSALDGIRSPWHADEIARARAGLAELFEGLLVARRAEPGDDVISSLAAAEEAGRVTHEELLSLASLLLVAGFETTVNLLGNAVAALLDRPDRWRRLTDDPGLAERAVDETLRFASPVQLTGRTPTRDLVVDEHCLPAGRGVIVLVGAANRDPDVFERPGEFSLDRPNPRDHLAFGNGIHHCVGRPLAELEGRLALAALARRLPRLRRAGRERMSSGVVLYGRRELPVRA